jgi:adenylate cyclase
MDGRPPVEGHGPAAQTELRTFLIADIRGYTTYTREHGDEDAAELAGAFAASVREVVAGHVVFVFARQALRAAVELQDRFAESGLARPVGIGLDAGEAVPVEGGYRGGALNLAARLSSRARPGEILPSEAVIHLVGYGVDLAALCLSDHSA